MLINFNDSENSNMMNISLILNLITIVEKKNGYHSLSTTQLSHF